MKPIVSWCDRHMIDNWRGEIRRLWSIRIAAVWLLVGALVTAAPMVSDEAKALLGAKAFFGLFVAGFVSIGLARLLKQPGADS